MDIELASVARPIPASAFWGAAPVGSRRSLHRLPPEQRPRAIRIGARDFYIETPTAWLERIARAQLGEDRAR